MALSDVRRTLVQIHDTSIAEVKRLSLTRHGDARGFFMERFRADIWEAAGFPSPAQCNHSRSAPGVLRGLHLQHTPGQGKLVGVTSSRIYDVAVDVRKNSPTYLQHVGVELDEATLLWVPEGFLHGFCVLGDAPADVLYFTTATYNAAGEGGVHYADPDIAIDWPVKAPTISGRDATLPMLKDATNLYKA